MQVEAGHPQAPPPNALSGIRVLDLSRILAGPWATQTLGDLGAHVIKVERPGVGDDTRAWGPPFLHETEGGATRDAAYFLCANRNKHSIVIDFTRAEGQELVRALAAKCDVLVENFKPGGLVQYGLDQASLRAVNPRLIYCSITGFGHTGPYANRPGYDFLMQGMGGLMSVTGRPDEEPGGGPMKVGVALTDILTGLYASTAILAALQWRGRSGLGQHIDLALLDVQVACLANQSMNYLYGDQVPGRLGNGHPNAVPYQDFPTANGRMIIAIGNDSQFVRFCKVAGSPEWATDPRFASNAARVKHRAELIALMSAVTAQRSTAAWMEQLEAIGVPCGPINTIEDVFEDAQVKARGMRLTLKHPSAGEIPLVASPLRLSDTPVRYAKAPPPLGFDTRNVLSELLDLPPAQLDALTRDGVIA